MSSPTSAPATPSPHAAIAERIIGNLVQASGPVVSPDGTQVAFVVSRVDMSENKTFTQVWLADVDGARPPRAVTGGEHDGQPVFSPDGRWLAFTSRRAPKKGDATLHLLPVHGPGETRTLATMKDGVGDVAFSPDGRWLGFTSRTRDPRYEAKGVEDGDTSWQAPRKIERFFSQINGEGWVFDRPQHVYVVPADGTGTPRNLTPGEFQHGEFSWLADSSAVVTSAGRHDTWDLDFAVDLYRVGLDGSATALTAQTGSYFDPAVSPDGSLVAFLGADDAMSYPQNVHVGVVPVGGGGHRWISKGLDRSFECTAGTQAPVWLSADTLVATAEDRGQTHLYRVHLDGRTPERLTDGPMTVKSFDAAGGTIAFAAGAVDAVSDVFVVPAGGGEARRLTGFADAYRAVAAPLGWERFAVPCTDGTAEIDAWIMRPRDFDPARQYPVLLNVHGGPHTQYGETLFDEAQMQASAGFVVVMCNPRGSSGREDAWGQSINGPHHPTAPGTGWGSVDVEDVMAVIRAALDRYPFCDAARVGMLGGSYGGYMATWLAGTTGRFFAAICSERAVNNMLTEEYTSDISSSFVTGQGRNHIEAPEEYERISPIRFVRDIEIPLLIVHSEDDLRCPVSQAEELFVAMRLLRKDVTFYRFPGEDHELSRSGSPVHRRMRAEIILDFFADKLGAA